MSLEPVVLDISSDEEDAIFDGSGEDSFDCLSSLEWLSKMLEIEDEPWASKNVVDLEVVSCAASVQKLNSDQLNVTKNASVDDSDDDCKVLDGDPDKPIDVTQSEGNGKSEGNGNGSDELLIVGEKGQVACRDFPHSRHLCATFPFSTTSHEKFCKLCHCYVCDVPAPCAYWDTGSSNVDHCHSSDKEEKWKLQRKALRHVNSAAVNTGSIAVATPPIRAPGTRPRSMRVPGIRTARNNFPQTMSSATMPIGPRSVHQTLVSIHSAPTQASVPMPVTPGSVQLQNSNSRLHTFQRCSSTSFGAPNILSQRRNHQSGIVHGSRRFTQLLNRSRNFPGTDDSRKECCGLPPQVPSAQTRGRMASAGFMNVATKRPRTTNVKQNQVYSRKVQRSSHLPASSVDESFKEWQDVLLGRDPNPDPNFRPCVVYPQLEMDGQAYTQTCANADTNLLCSSTPATNNPDFLDGGWFNAASANAASHVSLANSPLPDVQSTDLCAIPENDLVSGGPPFGELIGLPAQGPGQEAAGDQGLKELNPCTYDEQDMLNSFLYV